MRVDNFSLEAVSPGTTTRGAPSAMAFGERLRSAMEEVNTRQHVADGHLSAVAAGEEVDLHGAMIAMQEADITLRAMVSVRDKLVDGYQQLMNMSI